jgi:hypothetical protein
MLPAWLAFPFVEMFAAAFTVAALSAASAVLLGAAAVSQRVLPAAVGSVVAALVVAFIAASAWVVVSGMAGAALL